MTVSSTARPDAPVPQSMAPFQGLVCTLLICTASRRGPLALVAVAVGYGCVSTVP